VRHSAASHAAFTELGEDAHAAWQLVAVAFGETELGRLERAVKLLSQARKLAERCADEHTARHAELQLAYASARLGEVGPAIPMLRKVLAESEATKDQFTLRVARGYLAYALWCSGAREEAKTLAQANIEGVDAHAIATLFSGGILASILVEEGRHAEAIEVTTRLLRRGTDEAGNGEGLLRRALYRALDATESREAADEALATARDRLVARSLRISDEELRRGFLEDVESHALTLLEAKRRLG
jgi:tetratricopeptide (TPR) repeat protein